jgi:hypothetical protein
VSDYGVAIYNTSGVERFRFSDPIVAIYAFPVSGSGSVTVPGAYAHAIITVTPGIFVGSPLYHLHSVSLSSNDVITWYADNYTAASTIIFVNFCK